MSAQFSNPWINSKESEKGLGINFECLCEYIRGSVTFAHHC